MTLFGALFSFLQCHFIFEKKKISGLKNTAMRYHLRCMLRGFCVTLFSVAVLAINPQRVAINEGQLGKTGEESSGQETLGTALWRKICSSVRN